MVAFICNLLLLLLLLLLLSIPRLAVAGLETTPPRHREKDPNKERRNSGIRYLKVPLEQETLS
jgi:hypothetical protein